MKKANPINVAIETYGTTAMEADTIVLNWAVRKAELAVGTKAAAKGLRALNNKRERMGRIPYYPQWGTPIWAAYFNKA